MKDLILGNHLLFAREGDEYDDGAAGGTVAVDSLPSTEIEGNYAVIATVEDWSPKRTQTFVERRAPNPGRYSTRKRIPVSQKMQHAFSLQEWSSLTLAEILLGGNLPVAGDFVPGVRTEQLRGWWIVKSYDQTDAAILTLKIWGEAMIDSYKFGEKLDPYALVIEQLYSPLTSGKIENLT